MNILKKYSDYSDDISGDEIFESLVGYGLFADKLPDFLTSLNFLEYCKRNSFSSQSTNKKDNDYIRYLSMRHINIPRELGIPNPFAYANTCKTLSDNWSKLQEYFRSKTKDESHKVSRLHLRKTKNSVAIFEMNYKNFQHDGEPTEELAINNTHIAVADISNCFPSIYIHSIPWALVGKSYAKKHRNPDEWFNQIDSIIRKMKSNETNGLLIGPHVSNLISEIILVAVDNELVKKGYKYIRYIDDYKCYVNSVDKADRFMIDLSDALKQYGLSLNHKKSNITPILINDTNNWRNKLRHFNFIDNFITSDGRKGIKVKTLKSYLEYSVELLTKEDSNMAIINYAIKQIKDCYLGKSALNYYLKKIHHLALLYPYLIHYLESDIFDIHNIEPSIIKKIATDIYNYGINKKIYEAPSYAIHWALKYEFLLDIKTIPGDAINSSDCIFMLIAYKYNMAKQLNFDKKYINVAKSLKDEDFDKYWLFIYEVLPSAQLNCRPEFQKLKENNITFIKSINERHVTQKGKHMPEISRFFGMVVFMYWDEHNPPHFHVKYGGEQATINIQTLEIIEGKLNRRATELVLEWAELHQADLLENWDKCTLKQKPNKIAPLN